MIKVDRKNVAVPSYLTDPSKPAIKEKNKAIALFSSSRDTEVGIESKRNKFKFKAYNHPDVKDALKRLFKSKCAYCESKFLHVYYGDIEHFRPKKGVGEDKKNVEKPGYYWLAVDWDNLLLSCLFCNQAKKQHLPDGSLDTIGKQSQFPLDDSVEYLRRRKETDNIKDEDKIRLLIDPCKDKPEELLRYEDKGIILPKKSRGRAKRKAESSIHVYALQRMPLVQMREAKILEIKAQIQRVKEAFTHVNEHIENANLEKQIYFNSILTRELSALNEFCKPEKEFAGLARQYVETFIEEFGIEG